MKLPTAADAARILDNVSLWARGATTFDAMVSEAIATGMYTARDLAAAVEAAEALVKRPAASELLPMDEHPEEVHPKIQAAVARSMSEVAIATLGKFGVHDAGETLNVYELFGRSGSKVSFDEEDCVSGFVVVAANENDARDAAVRSRCGAECRCSPSGGRHNTLPCVWADRAETACELVATGARGYERVISRSFNGA